MNLSRKTESSSEEELHAKFFELCKGVGKEKRERVFADAGIFRQDGKCFWLFKPQDKRTINEMEIPWSVAYMAGEGAIIYERLKGVYITDLSNLTRLASQDWSNFISMAERLKWKEAKDLEVIELRNPVE